MMAPIQTETAFPTDSNMTADSKKFTADGLPTLIGSLPAANHQQAMDWILEYTPEIPLWPQIPALPKERMLNQFIEGLPGIIETEERTYFDVNFDSFPDEQLSFYEEYLSVSENSDTLLTSRFQTSDDRAAGLYLLAKQAKKITNLTAVKGQVTGPFTMLTGISDADKKLGYYNPDFRDIVVKGIAMKAAWQVAYLKEAYDVPVLLFIDEPALAGLGSSSFISISLDDIAQDLAEVIEAIHKNGGMAGVHVCANTDWNILLNSEIDILSFDAYSFFDKFITCKKLIHAFLERGSLIAWGIIPTSDPEHIQQETCDSLVTRWEGQADLLSGGDWNIGSLLKQTIITPSCGTGSLSPELAKRVLQLTKEVSTTLRTKYLE
jgi:methionine synthase II (cobalamin-independent)